MTSANRGLPCKNMLRQARPEHVEGLSITIEKRLPSLVAFLVISSIKEVLALQLGSGQALARETALTITPLADQESEDSRE